MWELKNGQARRVDNTSEEEVVIMILVVSYYSKIGSLKTTPTVHSKSRSNRNLTLILTLLLHGRGIENQPFCYGRRRRRQI